MKDEANIRRYRANLRLVLNQPCGCRGTAHDVKCQQAQLVNGAVERTLSWILDEYEEMQEHVDRLEKQARNFVPGE